MSVSSKCKAKIICPVAIYHLDDFIFVGAIAITMITFMSGYVFGESGV
jgi:hypothetical protein